MTGGFGSCFGSTTTVGSVGFRSPKRPSAQTPITAATSAALAPMIHHGNRERPRGAAGGCSVGFSVRSAGAVVMEVRRQFREFPGIMDGTQRPEYGKVVDICTRDAQRELITPGLLAILAPIAVGFGLGPGALASYLAGAIGALNRAVR